MPSGSPYKIYMPHKKFLEQIAAYYTDAARIDSLAEITFIFPNKRSAMFLDKYIRRHMTAKYILKPKFTTFARFAAHTAAMSQPSKHELLFMLYDAYVKAVTERNPDSADEQIKDFDKFIFWGDMILSDFDEIDKALADPRILYTNLKNLHELTADYLTDEQKEIVERIWGATPLTFNYIDTFWLHTKGKDGEEQSELTEKFLSLWQILARIYELLRKNLADSHRGTPGMQMREALRRIKDTPASRLKRRRYVFVGLSDVSNAELAIMTRLKEAGCADFFWDIESPLFQKPDGSIIRENKAFSMVSQLRSKFPMPSDFTLQPITEFPHIDIIGMPSAVAQAKLTGAMLAQMTDSEQTTSANAVNTAVVLPDPAQLMPLVLSLPENIPGVNVTMGMPYTSTNFATLFSSIIALQRKARKLAGRYIYFYQDVLDVLLHPHMMQLDPEHVQTVRRRIIENKQFNIDAEELITEFPHLSYIFTPVKNLDNLNETYDYVSSLLSNMTEAFKTNVDQGLFNKSFEYEFLKYFSKQTAELRDLMEKYHITMRESTFLTLFDRTLQAMNHNLEGTPLEGIQIMGVLETRGLDFDNVFYLSMNERTLPRRDYTKTMIPNNLRRGYGLAPIEQSENFYSYHFFRSLARARRVTLMYDTRTQKNGGSEISRYLNQLRNLYPGATVTHRLLPIEGTQPEAYAIRVEKTPEVMKQLDNFRAGGHKSLSASSLKSYLDCSLKFYFKSVLGLNEEDTPVDYLDSAQLGTLFHGVVDHLYKPYCKKLIGDSEWDEMMNGQRFDEYLIPEIAKKTGHRSPETATADDLSLEGAMTLAQIRAQVNTMLLVERDNCSNPKNSFTYIDGEVIHKSTWQINPDLAVNFKMIIDRIDRMDGETLRFIDYKTGADDSGVDSVEGLFKPGSFKKRAIFQLMLYAEAYQQTVDPNADIVPSLYIIKDIMKEGKIKDVSISQKKFVYEAPTKRDNADEKSVVNQFRNELHSMLGRIFDDTTPFEQTSKVENCTYCPFIQLCNR